MWFYHLQQKAIVISKLPPPQKKKQKQKQKQKTKQKKKKLVSGLTALL